MDMNKVKIMTKNDNSGQWHYSEVEYQEETTGVFLSLERPFKSCDPHISLLIPHTTVHNGKIPSKKENKQINNKLN